MIDLRDRDTGANIGSVTEEQLRFLVDQLEEEGTDDRNYWLNRDALEMLRENGADAALISLLETAMGDREDMEIEWS